MKKINWNQKYTTIATYSILVFIICYAIYKLTNRWYQTANVINMLLRILSPFIYALSFAYFLYPLVRRIEITFFKKLKNHNLKRGLSIASTYIIVLSTVMILLSFIMPQLIASIQEIAKLPGIYLPLIDQ